MIMVILLLFDFGGIFTTISQIFIYLSVILTVISLVDYIYKNRNVLKDVR